MKSNTKNIMLILLIGVFLLSVVSATSDFYLNSGIINNVKTNENYTFRFFAYNSTTGLTYQSSLTCTMTLYNNNNNQIFKATTNSISSDNSYQFLVNENNFTSSQTMQYRTYCNGTAAADSLSGSFLVTPTGNSLDIPTTILLSMLGLFLVSILVFLIGMFFKSETMTAKITYFNIIYLAALAILFLSWFVAYNYIYQLAFLGSFLYYTWFIMMILLFPEIIVSISIMLISNLDATKQKRLTDMGYGASESRKFIKR